MPNSIHDIHSAGADLVKDEFSGGARSVRLRAPTGTGFSNVSALLAAEQSRQGRTLVLCPRLTQEQFKAELARIAPDIVVGRWDSGAALILADALQVDQRAAGAAPERFDLVVIEEFHPEQLPRVRRVIERYPEARVLENTRAPRGAGGAIEPDTEIDLMDGPVHGLGGPPR